MRRIGTTFRTPCASATRAESRKTLTQRKIG